MLRRLLIASNTGPVDPLWSNVLFLLRLDGDAVDLKGRPFTVAGSPSFVAGKFGQALAPVVGADPSGVTDGTVGVQDYALGTGDFTIECWAKANTSLATDSAIISFFDVSTSNGWQLLVSSAGAPRFYQYVSGGSYPLTGTGVNLKDGSWHHIAVARSSGVMRMFVDGVVVGSVANTVNFGYSALYMSIGYQRQGNARYPFNGAIDEVRVTKGVARYTAAFNPPSERFPAG